MSADLYPLLKYVHVSCVVVTYLLFLLRGVWMVRDSALLRARWVRVVPHGVDTVLLASAIGLVMVIRQYPGIHGWLTAKIVAVLLYVLLGMAAFRFLQRRPARIAAWMAAQATFAYIVLVALVRDPFPL